MLYIGHTALTRIIVYSLLTTLSIVSNGMTNATSTSSNLLALRWYTLHSWPTSMSATICRWKNNTIKHFMWSNPQLSIQNRINWFRISCTISILCIVMRAHIVRRNYMPYKQQDNDHKDIGQDQTPYMNMFLIEGLLLLSIFYLLLHTHPY